MVDAKVAPATVDLILDDAIYANSDYTIDIVFKTSEGPDVFWNISTATDIVPVIKKNRDDEDADAIATGAYVITDGANGAVTITFLHTDITKDDVGQAWWSVHVLENGTHIPAIEGRVDIKPMAGNPTD